MAFDIMSMALHKVGAWRDRGNSKVSELQLRVEELIRDKEHIGVLLRSALQANTSEVLKVAEDGLREAGIEKGLNGHRDHRPGSAEKDEVYTLAGALENSMKESQIKIIELQHLVEAQRAESGLLRTRMEGQEKEIGQLRKQIKHLEEKEGVANDSLLKRRLKDGRWLQRRKLMLVDQLNKSSRFRYFLIQNTRYIFRGAAKKSLKLADTRSGRLRERLEELNRQAEESDSRTDPSSGSGHHRYVCWPWQWLGLNYVRLPPTETEEVSNEMELSEPLI